LGRSATKKAVVVVVVVVLVVMVEVEVVAVIEVICVYMILVRNAKVLKTRVNRRLILQWIQTSGMEEFGLDLYG
jgi:type IV secretory pathway VirB3-like protein